MRQLLIYIWSLLAVVFLAACSDDDSFSSSSALRLTFSADSVKVDTVFSRVPSITRTFWVYNKSGDGIRCQNVRLAKGNQTGFRVNVDGIYLGAAEGYQSSEIEVRNRDSIRVFVEVTTPQVNQLGPKEITDDLVFTLESGVEQRVHLSAWAWDAILLNQLHIISDTTISTIQPIVISGGLVIDSLATLRLLGTTLYFHENAGVDVYGTLITDAFDGRESVFRGDRLDRMFDYLPYDRVSGQWQGIHIHSSSFGNEIRNTDIHSTYNGIVCDSAACDESTPRLILENSTVHNCQGYGLLVKHSNVLIRNCQISNTLHDCFALYGGKADVLHTTLAQFYPFDAARGAALSLSNVTGGVPADLCFTMRNSIITGYADDVIIGKKDTTAVFDYSFENCLLRTPKVTDADSVHYISVIFEDSKDTTMVGKKNFLTIDEENLYYDFRLSAKTRAIDAANPTYALPIDRLGLRRDDLPDMGAYEYMK